MRIRTANRNHRRAITRSIEDLETKIFDWHCAFVHRMGQRLGHAIATNIGWAVTGTETTISVCSKVYGYGRITTTGYYDNRELVHDIDIDDGHDVEEDFDEDEED